MQWASLAAVALLAQNAAAQNMLRFACSQLVVDRVDPLVDPGMIYTPHLHQIVGGNSFNVTMDPVTHDIPALSTCTSCTFKEDTSNYWTAVMFFKAKNGTYIRVPQTGNGGPQGQLVNKGGLDVYYIPSGKVTAFKPVSGARTKMKLDLTNLRVSECLLEVLPTKTQVKCKRDLFAIVAGHLQMTITSLAAPRVLAAIP